MLTALIFGYFLSPTFSQTLENLRSIRGHIRAENVQLCGNELAEYLGHLCQFNFASVDKKNYPLSSNEVSNEDNIEDFLNSLKFSKGFRHHMPFPFKARMNSNSLIPQRFRRSTGIVEECCLKPCSYNELRGYCA